MAQIAFYSTARNDRLTHAVVAARWGGKWLLCRQGDAWTLPRGDREAQEQIAAAAQRILRARTGALEYQLEPVSAYSVGEGEETAFGALFFAEVDELDSPPREDGVGPLCQADGLSSAGLCGGLDAQLLTRAEAWLAEGHFRPAWEDILELMT